MAVDKLVDSTQLNSDLTSVADAIRAKSGGSGQLAFPAGFVSEIGNIPSGGGGNPGDEFEWASNVQVVTVGANSVSNTQAASNYFSGYTYNMCILMSEITTNNQYVFRGTSGCMRYRNGAVSDTVVGSNYDARLVEGTQYLLVGE